MAKQELGALTALAAAYEKQIEIVSREQSTLAQLRDELANALQLGLDAYAAQVNAEVAQAPTNGARTLVSDRQLYVGFDAPKGSKLEQRAADYQAVQRRLVGNLQIDRMYRTPELYALSDSELSETSFNRRIRDPLLESGVLERVDKSTGLKATRKTGPSHVRFRLANTR